MKKDSFLDFIVRNRYIIICVTIVLILAATGIIRMLIEILFTGALIIGAIYLGKRIQEDDEYISRIFKKRKNEVKYTVKDDERKE